MAKGDISVVGGGLPDPANLRASGGIGAMPSYVDVPPEDDQSSWLDRLLETVAGPKMTEDPNYGPDSTMAQLYDKYARPMNPLNLLVGAAKEVPALAVKVPLNAARFASRFSPDPNGEQYLSGDDPDSIGARMDALTKTGALGPRDFGQSVGAAGTDIMAMVAGDEAAGLPALSEALPSSLASLPGAARVADWAGTNIGKGALYGQLLDNDAETGAVTGGIGGAALDAGGAALSRAAPFLESAAEKSLGRVIAPGKEAWKKFVGKNAQQIIRDVPVSAAAPWREGGGLQGIVDFAQQQADNIGTSLDAAYAARLQPDIAPKLKGIRDQIRSTADGLLQAHGMAVVNLAPESKQALEEIRASLATGRGALNPKDTNISVLQDAASRLQDVVSGLGPEMQRVGAASPRAFQGQMIQRGIARGAQSTAEQGIAQAMGDIGDVINTDLVGTRMASEPLARRIDKLRMKFGEINAAGEFVSSDPAFTNNIAKLAETVRAYGPEMNAQQLRGLAQDWGKIVSGANGRGFLTSMADESMKGAMKAARGEVETTRDALMGDKVRDQSNEMAFWLRLSDAAASTAERRVGHVGGGLFGSMATLAGFEGGAGFAAHHAGAGLFGMVGAGAMAAPAAAVTVRVMRSPLWNLMSAKTKLAMASALRAGTNDAMATAMRRALLELSLLNHGGLGALGHQDLSATEADAEHYNLTKGRGVTPGVLEAPSPDAVYGADGSVDPGIEHNQRLLQQQDQIDSTLEEQHLLDPQTESRVYDKLANTQVAQAGIGSIPRWMQSQLVNAPDLGAAHPHLQKLANLIAEQTSPLNLAFLGVEGARPLAEAGQFARPVEMIGKGLSAAMAAAGLQTGLEGVQEGRPGKVIGGGVQTALGALGLRGGGVAGAAEEAATALTPAARRAGGFVSRLGQGLAGAGKAAVIGPALGLASQTLADSDLAKSLIPDDETRNAVFNAAGMGLGVGGLAMAAGKGMKGVPPVDPTEVTVPTNKLRLGAFKHTTAQSIYNDIVAGDGITVDLKTGIKPDTGSMTGLYPNSDTTNVMVKPLANFSAGDITKYVKTMRGELAKGGRFFGGWVSTAEDTPYGKILRAESDAARTAGDTARADKLAAQAEKLRPTTDAATQYPVGTKLVYLDASKRIVNEKGNIADQVRSATKVAEGPEATALDPNPDVRESTRQSAIYTADGLPAHLGSGPFTDVRNWRSFIEGPKYEERYHEMAALGDAWLKTQGGHAWWKLQGSYIEHVYGPDLMKEAAGYLAATSPRTTVAQNIRQASVYLQRRIKGEPLIQPDWRMQGGAYYGKSGLIQMPMETVRVEALNRAMRGEPVGDLKIGDMQGALWGKPDPVTADTHHSKLAEDPTRGIYLGTVPGKISDAQYPILKAVMQAHARARGETPADYSAKAWTGIIQEIQNTGQLYGTPYKLDLSDATPMFEQFRQIVEKAAAHHGYSLAEFEHRLRKGDANLMATLLSTGVGMKLYQQWQASQDDSPESAAASARPAAQQM